jgi:hypothetical protein
MSAKPIREATGKELLNKFLQGTAEKCQFCSVDETNVGKWGSLLADNAWISSSVSYTCKLDVIGRECIDLENDDDTCFRLSFSSRNWL